MKIINHFQKVYFISLIFFGSFEMYSLNHLFLEIDSKKEIAIIGNYSPEKFKRQKIKTVPISELNEQNEHFFDQNDGEILIYIHSMWGGQKVYHKNSLENLNTILAENDKITKVISILWHTPNFSYQKSWKNVDKSGALLANWFSNICSKNLNKINLLCHSMGHRFFEGIIREIDYVNFNKIVFAAADLNDNFFDIYASKFKGNVNQFYVFQHQNDKLLKASKKRLKINRMGLDGVHDFENISKKLPIKIIDVTNTKSNRKIELSHHIYFKTNEEVRQQIKEILD